MDRTGVFGVTWCPVRCALYVGLVENDTWASLADLFADQAYATVKGYVRTYVMHQQLLEQLPPAPLPCSMLAAARGISRSRWLRPAMT